MREWLGGGGGWGWGARTWTRRPSRAGRLPVPPGRWRGVAGWKPPAGPAPCSAPTLPRPRRHPSRGAVWRPRYPDSDPARLLGPAGARRRPAVACARLCVCVTLRAFAGALSEPHRRPLCHILLYCNTVGPCSFDVCVGPGQASQQGALEPLKPSVCARAR